MKQVKILVVGISPPPYGGQALMIESMLNARYTHFQLYHVRMSFSNSMASMGRINIRKILHMMAVVGKAYLKKFQHNISILYYVPGGSSAAPVIRDIVILTLLRLIFKHTILHFHAAGVSEIVDHLPGFLKSWAHYVYSRPSLAIYLSERNPDGKYFKHTNSMIVPNGLPDEAKAYLPLQRNGDSHMQLLFVGVIQESKGVLILLEAIVQLIRLGVPLEATFVGEFVSQDFELAIKNYCKNHEMIELIHFPGVKTGSEKWRYYSNADIFCFPSFFESESFGNVVVEAMMFELPVVATHWRGIPDLVEDQRTGILVPIQDSQAIAEGIERLARDQTTRLQMGRLGRERYLKKYQLNIFTRSMEQAFYRLGGQ